MNYTKYITKVGNVSISDCGQDAIFYCEETKEHIPALIETLAKLIKERKECLGT